MVSANGAPVMGAAQVAAAIDAAAALGPALRQALLRWLVCALEVRGARERLVNRCLALCHADSRQSAEGSSGSGIVQVLPHLAAALQPAAAVGSLG